MANTTKLAGTFKAVRYVIGVRLEQLKEVGAYFRRAGLVAEGGVIEMSGGWDPKDETLGMRVIVPSSKPDNIHGEFWKEMEKLGITERNLRHAAAVNLLCPLSVEKSIDPPFALA